MLALQINNQWAVLSEDQSVTIEENSPVWGGGNTFSLPFELDVEANRHILGNSDQLTGMSVYDVLEGQSATLYVMGIPLFYGKLSLEDEVEIENGTVEVSLISSTLAFDDMIDGMNCQDVEMAEEIVLGERWSEYSISSRKPDGSIVLKDIIKGLFPSYFMRMRDGGNSTVNLSVPYPDAKYCNMRICYNLPDELQDNEKGPEKELKNKYNADYVTPVLRTVVTINNNTVKSKYVTLDAERPLSAPCFYVLYFFECLFRKLGIDFDFSQINGKGDFNNDINRLAFVSTSCSYVEKETEDVLDVRIPWDWLKDYMVVDSWDYPILHLKITNKDYDSFLLAPIKKCIATSESFPDTDVSEVVKSMQNGFGIRFLFNKEQSKVTLVYVKDILRSKDVEEINAEVLDVYKKESSIRGFVLKYNDKDEDTSFKYDEWSNYIITNSFNYIQMSVSANNKKLYIDARNGNSYRVKNDEDATEESDQRPSLFEVAMFLPVRYGDCSDENKVEEVIIPFAPLVVNDTAIPERLSVLNAKRMRGVSFLDDAKTDDTNNEQRFASLLDVEMKYPSLRPAIKVGGYVEVERNKLEEFEFSYTYVDTQRYDEKYTDQSLKKIKENRREHRSRFGTPVAQKYLDNDSPIQTFDAGLTLGIMRGPGSTSGVQDYAEDYDGEGNSKYVTTPANYAFHPDTVDNYARVFDYNGTGDDGVDTSKRFSLKLRAEKPYPDILTDAMKKEIEAAGLQKWSDGKYYHPITQPYAQRRGLFDKFYTEYAHFVTHRKIAKLTLRMEVADLVNIDWTKRYRIGSFTGFINSYSYTVDSQGISEVQMELYYI